MNPGIAETGRWPSILGEKERKCRNATDSKLIDFSLLSYIKGARGSLVVKALRYKPAGRGFDSRWCHWNFSVT